MEFENLCSNKKTNKSAAMLSHSSRFIQKMALLLTKQHPERCTLFRREQSPLARREPLSAHARKAH